MFKIIEKGLSILDTILKRILDPAVQERLYKVTLTKKRRVALETAEGSYRWIRSSFLPFIKKHLKFKDNRDLKRWHALLKKLKRDEDKFFVNE